MKKKYRIIDIILNFTIFFLIFLNSFISLVLNVISIIFLNNKGKCTYLLLILNLSLINLYRIPHSDYFRYFIRYYDLGKLSIDGLKKYLLHRTDYIFYISKYVFAINKISFFIWAFCYSLFIYIILYMISLDLKNRENRIFVFFLISPFNMTRFVGAMILFSYGFIKVSKVKKHIIIVCSWLTHKFFLISYIILFLKKNRIIISKYLTIILVLFTCLLMAIFRNIVVNFIGEHIFFSEKYYNLNKLNLEFSLYAFRKYIKLLLGVVIYIIICNDKKNGNFMRVNLIVLAIMFQISKVISGRYFGIILFVGTLLFFKNVNKGLKRKLVISLLFLIQLIEFQDNIRYGLKTNTYPFYQKIQEKEEILNKLTKEGSIK